MTRKRMTARELNDMLDIERREWPGSFMRLGLEELKESRVEIARLLATLKSIVSETDSASDDDLDELNMAMDNIQSMAKKALGESDADLTEDEWRKVTERCDRQVEEHEAWQRAHENDPD